MHTTPEMTAGSNCLMAPAEKTDGSGNSGNGGSPGSGIPASEPSLADGTGEGNAPIDGTSASAEPEVLAGTSGNVNAASLNDDDYPENVPVNADGGDDSGDGTSQTDPAEQVARRQAAPDQAAGVSPETGPQTPNASDRE